jgi:PTH2 family peptidyl-tRNA hydrolase
MEKQKMVAPDVKQVILVRNDLKMSPGKAAAQVGHAAILFMVHDLHTATDQQKSVYPLMRETQWMYGNGPINATRGQIAYGGMKKIVLGVQDLDELSNLHWKAKEAGIKVYNVFDEGVNDITACAIGPDYAYKIDPITGSLALYGPQDWDFSKPVKEEFQPTKEIYGVDVANMLDRDPAFDYWERAARPKKPRRLWDE